MECNILCASGDELSILATVISINLGKVYDADDLNTISNFLTSVGDLVGLIAGQKERCLTSMQANTQVTAASNNKNSTVNNNTKTDVQSATNTNIQTSTKPITDANNKTITQPIVDASTKISTQTTDIFPTL